MDSYHIAIITAGTSWCKRACNMWQHTTAHATAAPLSQRHPSNHRPRVHYGRVHWKVQHTVQHVASLHRHKFSTQKGAEFWRVCWITCMKDCSFSLHVRSTCRHSLSSSRHCLLKAVSYPVSKAWAVSRNRSSIRQTGWLFP